jgi:hypothetical protein
MKKVLIVFVLIMAVLAVNAQATKATTTPVRAAVMVADLQKAITDNVAKDYAGYAIKEATSVTENGVVTYEVGLFQGSMTMTILYDKDGKFIKKLPTVPKKL